MSFLSRIFPTRNKRSYEGAGGSSRWPDTPATWVNNANSLQSSGTLAARARHAYANNPTIRQGVATLVSALVGTGIKPQSSIADPEARATINKAFEAWTDHADSTGRGDFYAQIASLVQCMIIDGEAFAIDETDPETGILAYRQIAAEQVDRNLTRDLGNGGRIVAGVEYNSMGRRIAYHIFPDDPGLPFATSLQAIRIPAGQVIHLFRQDFPGQVRGVSWLAPVLLVARDLDKAMDANLMRLQVASLFAGFITDAEGGTAGMDELSTDSLKGGIEPGFLKFLKNGQSMEFAVPPGVGADVIDYFKLLQRNIAAGLGVTFEQLTGDYSKSNYSSARAAIIEFRRKIETIQHHTIIFQMCRPIWRRWLTLEVMSGRLDAPGFESAPEQYLTPQWITPGWQWVDPSKEVAAQRDAVEAGFMSRREVVAGRGLDIEDLDADRAADAARDPNTIQENAG